MQLNRANPRNLRAEQALRPCARPGRAILSKDLSYVIIIVCGVQVAAALSLGASRNSAGQVGQAGLPKVMPPVMLAFLFDSVPKEQTPALQVWLGSPCNCDPAAQQPFCNTPRTCGWTATGQLPRRRPELEEAAESPGSRYVPEEDLGNSTGLRAAGDRSRRPGAFCPQCESLENIQVDRRGTVARIVEQLPCSGVGWPRFLRNAALARCRAYRAHTASLGHLTACSRH